ncbi:hypothetical protein P171DRAFT_260950 [Karstenula rhodostoma CBS 690.94]|uniref:Uncharacterized protein n=1 Tax=Karstenula rhodostoma CBS 690.94 TaxID=1392251 RepID=A0A9P4PK01_9PLEO|nr:hypothetical protein P171DRAFT_260950 [Karstenula rhodostoma CBS 690.94]
MLVAMEVAGGVIDAGERPRLVLLAGRGEGKGRKDDFVRDGCAPSLRQKATLQLPVGVASLTLVGMPPSSRVQSLL